MKLSKLRREPRFNTSASFFCLMRPKGRSEHGQKQREKREDLKSSDTCGPGNGRVWLAPCRHVDKAFGVVLQEHFLTIYLMSPCCRSASKRSEASSHLHISGTINGGQRHAKRHDAVAIPPGSGAGGPDLGSEELLDSCGIVLLKDQFGPWPMCEAGFVMRQPCMDGAWCVEDLLQVQ